MASVSLTLLSPLFSNSSKSSLKLGISNANQTSIQESLNLICIDSKRGVSVSQRRETLIKGLALLPLVVFGGAPISEAREVEVGSYLPPSPTDPSFVVFKASPKDTPALRAVLVLLQEMCSRTSFLSHPHGSKAEWPTSCREITASPSVQNHG
uniref:Uncharacterized protein n=1 Tax=Gossypium raimondii TaxID=29730 RepID=A0A0D2SD31_GOSRA|nr:hypothetical protein B456_013G125600 [Gossypium raimondii]KJB81022.1 hypothetical protein B456_013G125600 [Gossypium raimondii]